MSETGFNEQQLDRLSVFPARTVPCCFSENSDPLLEKLTCMYTYGNYRITEVTEITVLRRYGNHHTTGITETLTSPIERHTLSENENGDYFSH